jgi:hypothetical protein
MKRVAYISTCGQGHLNTIRSLWSKHGGRLFLLRFSDETLPLDLEEREGHDIIVLTCNGKRPSEEAAVFNHVRSAKLRDALHVWLHDYAPTLVVYDFFCIEARIVARILGVPAICSIPATLKPDETMTCSDALLPQEHMYWVWRDAYPVSIKPVIFLGPRRVDAPPKFVDNGVSTVIVTFGTVIPKYPGCQSKLDQLMKQVRDYVDQDNGKTRFVFAGIQGPNYKNCYSYTNPQDLPLLFSLPRVSLIFHGGGNTYAEALAAGVSYILACPFFGDQFETARQCGNLYSGDLIYDMKHLKPVPPSPLKVAQEIKLPFQDRFPDYFQNGDLVFGHRRHRKILQDAFPQVNLHLEHFKPFSDFANPEAGDLPAIADVYNDEFALQQQQHPPPDVSEYHRRLSIVALKRPGVENSMSHLPSEHRLVHHCLDILELTVTNWKGRIHFVLGPLDDLGPATKIELEFIEKEWETLCHSILFYDLQGRRIPAPWSCRPKTRTVSDTLSLSCSDQNNPVACTLLNIPGRIPIVWGRRKSDASISEKEHIRKLPLLDVYAWRTGYLNQEDLRCIQEKGVPPNWTVSVNWCHQKVWYYYYQNMVELQIWPWSFLHCFYLNEAGTPTQIERQFQLQELIESVELK